MAGDGSVYVVGGPNGFLRKYSPAGSLLWSRTSSAMSTAAGVAVGKGGNIYVAGGYGSLVLERYSSGGELSWKRVDASVGAARAIAVAPDGNIYVLVNHPGITLLKYSVDGKLIWRNTYPNEQAAGFGVAVSRDGRIYVVGFYPPPGKPWCIWLRKYSPDGKTIWTKVDGDLKYLIARYYAYDVGVNSLGEVWVVGQMYAYENGRSFLRKYSPAGALLSTSSKDLGVASTSQSGQSVSFISDGIYSVMFDRNDDVYMAGYGADTAYKTHMILKKWDY